MTYESITPVTDAEALYIPFFEALSSNSCLMRADAPRYTIIAITPQHLKLTGLKKENIIGKGVFEVFPPNANDPTDTGGQNFLASLQHVLTHKEPHYLPVQRYDIADAQGVFMKKYWKAESKPVLSPNGEVAYILHTTEDITDHVMADEMKEQMKGMEQAEALKRLYETVTNNTPDLIYVFDLNYQFTYANSALLAMWGKTWDDAIGKGLRENGYEEWHAQMHEREIDQVIATKSPIRGEVSFPHATLGRRVYDYIFVPVLNKKGAVEAVAGTTRDITDIRLAEKTIKESNERFNNLADESPLFVFIIDADPKAPVSYWNKTWLKYTGQSHEEAVGRAWDGILHPDDVPIVMEHYTPAFQAEQPYFIPAVRVKRHDGEYRWHAFKGNPRYSPAGAFNGYVGVGLDVHDQKMAEEALKQSERNLRNMILQAPIAIAILRTKEYVVEIVNKHALEFWGRTYEEVINRPLFAALPELSTQGFREFFDGIYDSGVPIHLKEHPITFMRNGKMEDFYFNFLYEVLYDAYGKVNGLMAIGVDVTLQTTTRLKIEEAVEERTKELAKANEELKRSNQNLEEFAHAASHDLKEPVRKIHFFTTQLKDQLRAQLEEGQERAFSRIENATERMGNLIDDLLLYSHVSQRPHETEPVDLNQKVRVVLEDLELDITEKKAVIAVGKLPVVNGYRRQLQQLFQNLISNAIKYSKADVPPRIDIRTSNITENGASYHLIEVKDNGIGFQPEYAEKIFQMFTRLHGKNEYSGTGVGLSIVKKVVQNHNGLVRVESSPGQGSTFSVLLPVE